MLNDDTNEAESEFEFLQQAKRKLELLTQNLRNKRKVLRTLADRPKMLMRQTITGDKSKRVRDHVKEKTANQREKVREKLQEPPVIRFLDKTGFLLGVVGLSLTLWIFARFPQHFWWWYVAMITTLVSIRYWMYRQQKWQYFLIDFCYFAQASLLCNLLFFPRCTWLWKANYVISHGPLLWAIPTWRNSFVFHSLDKVTSIFLHGLPPLVTYCVRWHSIRGENSMFAMCPSDPNQPCWISLSFILTRPVLLYFVWQVLYILKTELWDHEKIRHDPMLATSIRWLSGDNANAMNQVTLVICRKVGLFGRSEVFNAETWKTKIVFWVVQFVYTVITLLPAYVAFHHASVDGALLWVMFFVSVWNGASYYVEVFSQKYALKFKPTPSTSTPTPTPTSTLGKAVRPPPSKRETAASGGEASGSGSGSEENSLRTTATAGTASYGEAEAEAEADLDSTTLVTPCSSLPGSIPGVNGNGNSREGDCWSSSSPLVAATEVGR